LDANNGEKLSREVERWVGEVDLVEEASHGTLPLVLSA
jgi:hypothetical protein